MARFDVYSHPDSAARRTTPYLLDVQNSHLQAIATRIVVPLRSATAFPLRMRDLNPVFRVGGKEVVAEHQRACGRTHLRAQGAGGIARIRLR